MLVLMDGSPYTRVRMLFVAGVAVVCLAVWFAAYSQRAALTRTADALRANTEMLVAMLDQETGLRGYKLSGRDDFLAPYTQGRLDFERGLDEARALAGDDRALVRAIDAQAAVARTWQDSAEAASRTGRQVVMAQILGRKATMDAFRRANTRASRLLDQRRERHLREAALVPIVLIAVLSGLLGGLGLLMVSRRVREQERLRAERRRREDEVAEFTDMLVMTRGEDEANDLLRRHIERSLPGTRAMLLRANASENRLEAATEAAPDVAAALDGAEPGACLAVRFGRVHAPGRDSPPLVACAVCGAEAGRSACVPSLVGGHVIGSVLVRGEEPLGEDEVHRVREAVTQASPVVDNLRNLARAERRAATDALTGLPNARALDDTLRRMIAQAGRTLTPLTAIMLDLDRFKALNDDYGHDLANDVLATVGAVLQGESRASDFAARFGGEEFTLLLPDTDKEGARVVAEKLLAALREISVPGVDRTITASAGVATYPGDAAAPEHLLRVADRALYAAKQAGRDRVVLAASKPEPAPAA